MWWKALKHQALALAARFERPFQHVHPTADIATTAVLVGDVRVGAGTRICHGAFVQGPVWLGNDCMIGNMAIIRGPVCLGDGSRIGFSTEIKNSLIEDNVAVGPQCFIADSRIETGVYLGAQVRTSNHRLDRKTIRALSDGKLIDTGLDKLGAHIGARASLGVQVIVLPGRTIAADTLLEPRITVEKNLPTGRYKLIQQIIAVQDHQSVGY